MELFQLKYFVNIADTLSFSRSAESLHVSQPALSHQMQQLERELGTKLFDREHRKIKLTPSGEVFLPLAQAVLFRADEAIRVLKEHMGVETGDVRMGCNPSVATYVAPKMLATLPGHLPAGHGGVGRGRRRRPGAHGPGRQHRLRGGDRLGLPHHPRYHLPGR